MVTTNPFVKEMDFYNPHNVLIVDKNTSEETIRQFLEDPYVKLPTDLIQRYDFNNWLNHLDLLNK